MEKCSIFPAGVDELTKEQLLALTGFTQGIFPIRDLSGGTEERRKMSLCGMGQGLPSKEVWGVQY
ncbi:hypothetical protein KY290_015222 [Solanum tuberosum]|uniref:Uncharacterized protein n=1 Tax=Solanum tuberosum TaxID=4113 RepID=A0ABQ7VT58_SOLTU|nr:hypothetical protein KY289_014833 [Solanum tuberosum]KAH0771241.1 hypothetical protein KY290_015222 [Solanum tuberosum]